jgi:hypothetical protein
MVGYMRVRQVQDNFFDSVMPGRYIGCQHSSHACSEATYLYAGVDSSNHLIGVAYHGFEVIDGEHCMEVMVIAVL